MNDYEFIANFDLDEIILPGPRHGNITLPQLLSLLDHAFPADHRKPDDYTFKRVYVPDAEEYNGKMYELILFFVLLMFCV